MVAACAALITAACSTLDKRLAGDPPAPAAKPAAAVAKPIQRPPAPPPKPTAPAPVASAPLPDPAPRPPIALIGLSEAEVEAQLGPPLTRANEGAGRSWRYASGGCELTVFFFLDLGRNAFYALDQKVMAGADSAGRCARRIADARTADARTQ